MVSYRFILNSIQPYQHAYIHQIQYWVEKWIFINIHVIWWLLIDTGIKGKIDGLISFHLYHIRWWNILVVISFPFFFKQKKSPIPFIFWVCLVSVLNKCLKSESSLESHNIHVIYMQIMVFVFRGMNFFVIVHTASLTWPCSEQVLNVPHTFHTGTSLLRCDTYAKRRCTRANWSQPVLKPPSYFYLMCGAVIRPASSGQLCRQPIKSNSRKE